jgi:hypothetical protein
MDKIFLVSLTIVLLLCGFFFTIVNYERMSIVFEILSLASATVLGFVLQNEQNKKYRNERN